MRKLTIAAALVVAIASSSVHAFGLVGQQAKKADLHFGAGTRLCSEWTSDRASGSWGQKAQWLLGYFSAVNVRGEIGLTSRITGDAFDTETAFKLTDAYCHENPTHTMHDFAKVYVREVGFPIVEDDDLEW